ncbi:MAG: Mu-like prophage major head subunit gpT family protein [Actinomycetota bacterium]|nr:Mu-like prophage major head subunit gpT family protein [Actinomycetota bacterium]
MSTESSTQSTAATATVEVRRAGFADDSVAGYEYAVTAARHPEGWVVVSATRTTLCYRGVSGAHCV